MTKLLRKIINALVLGGGIVLFACLLRFEQGEEFKHFCDAFSFAGISLLTVAGLGYLRCAGAFLGLGFALKRTKEFLLPFLKKDEETYGEYRRRKTEETDDDVSVLPFFTAGLFYLAIACVLLVFYAL